MAIISLDFFCVYLTLVIEFKSKTCGTVGELTDVFRASDQTDNLASQSFVIHKFSSFSGQVIKKTKTKGTLIDYYRMFLVDLGLACITSNSRCYYFYKVFLADLSENARYILHKIPAFWFCFRFDQKG